MFYHNPVHHVKHHFIRTEQTRICHRSSTEDSFQLQSAGEQVDRTGRISFHGPTALNECLEGYRYLLENAERLRIDTSRMMIGGDSAGGLLAMDTYLSLEVSEMPIGLMLIYPVVDDAQTTPSMKIFDDTPAWNAVNNAKMWDWYLDGQEYSSPLERHEEFDVKHLFVEVEEFDCLHDEGVMIFEALSPSCDHSVLLDNKGTFHGYDINFKADITQASLQERIRFLSESFSNRHSPT